MKGYIYRMIDLRNSLDKEWDKLTDIVKKEFVSIDDNGNCVGKKVPE